MSLPSNKIIVVRKCQVCRNDAQVTVDEDSYYQWTNGVLAQEAFPDLTDDEREILISNTHGECFDKIVPTLVQRSMERRD